MRKYAFILCLILLFSSCTPNFHFQQVSNTKYSKVHWQDVQQIYNISDLENDYETIGFLEVPNTASGGKDLIRKEAAYRGANAFIKIEEKKTGKAFSLYSLSMQDLNDFLYELIRIKDYQAPVQYKPDDDLYN